MTLAIAVQYLPPFLVCTRVTPMVFERHNTFDIRNSKGIYTYYAFHFGEQANAFYLYWTTKSAIKRAEYWKKGQEWENRFPAFPWISWYQGMKWIYFPLNTGWEARHMKPDTVATFVAHHPQQHVLAYMPDFLLLLAFYCSDYIYSVKGKWKNIYK